MPNEPLGGGEGRGVSYLIEAAQLTLYKADPESTCWIQTMYILVANSAFALNRTVCLSVCDVDRSTPSLSAQLDQVTILFIFDIVRMFTRLVYRRVLRRHCSLLLEWTLRTADG